VPRARDLSDQLARSGAVCLPLDPSAWGGARIDQQTSADMAARLVRLQRQRLAESQVLDRRARRVLHDEVGPRLHTAMLSLSGLPNGTAAQAREAAEQLAQAHREIADLLREMPAASAPEVGRLGLIGALRQEVTNRLIGEFDAVDWEVDAAGEQALEALPPLAAEVLYGAAREALRNAARHGRRDQSGRALHVRVRVEPTPLRLTIEDDGPGLDQADRERDQSEAGRGVADGWAAAGAGQGRALHSTLMAVIGGRLSAHNAPTGGARVELLLPEEALRQLR
jgi:signal transduction histidine kinase